MFHQLDFAHQVPELAAVLDVTRATWPGHPTWLIGHSAGATVAALYAAGHPGEIAA